MLVWLVFLWLFLFLLLSFLPSLSLLEQTKWAWFIWAFSSFDMAGVSPQTPLALSDFLDGEMSCIGV